MRRAGLLSYPARRHCIKEILGAVRRNDIALDLCLLSTARAHEGRNSPNLVIEELQVLKGQGKVQGEDYTIDVYVDDGSAPIPDGYRRYSTPTGSPYGKVGETRNLNYDSERATFDLARARMEDEVFAELKPSWKAEHDEWEARPMEYWEQMSHECRSCSGEGEIYYRIADWGEGSRPCESCGGTGTLTAERLRASHKPQKWPADFGLGNHIRNEVDMRVRERLGKCGLKEPTLRLSVCVKFTPVTKEGVPATPTHGIGSEMATTSTPRIDAAE